MDWRTVSFVVGTIVAASSAYFLLKPLNGSAASVAFAIAICSTAYLVGLFGKYWQAKAEERRKKALTHDFKPPWSDGSDEVVVNFAMGALGQSLVNWMASDKGVHGPTLLTTIGALAGFSAQYAERSRIADGKVAPDQLSDAQLAAAGMFKIETTSGEVFFFGDGVNRFLIQEKAGDQALWSLIAGRALKDGVKLAELPDQKAIFKHVAATVGGPQFGILTVDPKDQSMLTPRQALEMFWPRAKWIFEKTDGPGPAAGRCVDPKYWPIIMALLAQQCMEIGKESLDLRVSARIVMEAAVAMSKVDPKSVPQVWKDAASSPRPVA